MRPDVYVRAGNLTEAAPVQPAPWRSWQFSVQEVQAPAVTGSRVTLPEATFRDVSDRYGPFSNYPSPLIEMLGA
jgi:hypothetical protein